MSLKIQKAIYLFSILTLATITSCSSDDDSTTSCTETLWYADTDLDGLGDPNVSISSCTQPDGYVSNNDDDFDGIISTTNYHMLSMGNTWIYDVATNDGTNPVTNTVDEITVDETTIINTHEYFGMSSSTGSSGIMSQLYDQNYFRVYDGVTYMEGEFILPLSTINGTDLAIDLNNTKLIDESKSAGTILSTQSGDTAQNIGGIDLDITYTLKTVQQEILTTHTVNNETYSNVIISDIIISATATTNIGITFTILPTQDIYVIKNYYAEGIGLIDSNAVFSYQLVDIPGQTLPIPSSGSVETTQKITSYTLN